MYRHIIESCEVEMAWLKSTARTTTALTNWYFLICLQTLSCEKCSMACWEVCIGTLVKMPIGFWKPCNVCVKLKHQSFFIFRSQLILLSNTKFLGSSNSCEMFISTLTCHSWHATVMSRLCLSYTHNYDMLESCYTYVYTYLMNRPFFIA